MTKSAKNIKEEEYLFSEEEIAGFTQTKQDFKDGKTTACDWTEIEEELNKAYNTDLDKS